MKVYLFFPAYNEEKLIESVIRNAAQVLKDKAYTLVVVNDGSQDRTLEILNRLDLALTIVSHPQNRGLGRALLTGIETILPLAKDDDIIVTTESDGAQRPEKLLELIQAVEKGADLAVATPLHADGFKGVPAYRRFLSRGANVIYSTLFPIPGLNNYTNLSRAMRGSLLKKAYEKYGPTLIQSPGFEGVPELVLKLRHFNPKIAEVPTVIDTSKNDRKSSMNVLKTIVNSLKLCVNNMGK
ncbi:MAG: glycosyltransferase family 2 protein [Parachlamydiaceae bacterium]